MAKNINEVAKNETINEVTAKNEKIEVKLPDPIILKASSGETIKMTAIDEYRYKKEYFNRDADIVTATPRRVKEVKLPVSRDGERFRDTWSLFIYLQKNCNYKRFLR